MSKWISVELEKVPANEVVDIWVDWQDMTGRLCNCFYNPVNNKFWYWDDKCKNKIQIYADYATHWMRIPDAPEVAYDN